MVDAGDARCRRRHGNGEVALNQMLAEGGRVRRTASGAGDNQLGRTLVEARDQARQRLGEGAGLPRNDIRGGGNLLGRQ